MSVQIWHNPRCTKSRQTLSLLEEKGLSPEIVAYLEAPPSAQDIKAVLKLLGMRARDLLRKGEEEYKALGLDNEALSEDALIAAMVKSPKLIERPVVLANGKAAIGRPPENILAIL